MIGFGTPGNRNRSWRSRGRALTDGADLARRGGRPAGGWMSCRASMSAPAQKPRPAPVSTITPHRGRRRWPPAWPRSPRAPSRPVQAFSRSGRFSVIGATPSVTAIEDLVHRPSAASFVRAGSPSILSAGEARARLLVPPQSGEENRTKCGGGGEMPAAAGKV